MVIVYLLPLPSLSLTHTQGQTNISTCYLADCCVLQDLYYLVVTFVIHPILVVFSSTHGCSTHHLNTLKEIFFLFVSAVINIRKTQISLFLTLEKTVGWMIEKRIVVVRWYGCTSSGGGPLETAEV